MARLRARLQCGNFYMLPSEKELKTYLGHLRENGLDGQIDWRGFIAEFKSFQEMFPEKLMWSLDYMASRCISVSSLQTMVCSLCHKLVAASTIEYLHRKPFREKMSFQEMFPEKLMWSLDYMASRCISIMEKLKRNPSHESRIPVNSRNMGHTENRNSGVRVHLVALKSGKNGTISLPLKSWAISIRFIS